MTIITDRAAAGATYVTALASLRTAWIALKSYDIALRNKAVLAQQANPALLAIGTFGQASEWNPACLRHQDFALTPEYVAAWTASAEAAAATLVAANS